MSLQASVGKQVNEELKVFSNEKLMSIIRDMMYVHSILYLKVDVKLEEDPYIDDEFTHVLHYNFNILEYKRAGCGPLETRNISFSYHDLKDPNTKFYDSKGGSYFFDDPLIMNSNSDTYKRFLLKKYALLSFIYEFRHNLKLNKKSSDKILNQLQDVESTLFFKFYKDVNEEIYEPKNKEFKKFLYISLGKYINGITYSSYYTKWDYDLSKEVEVKPKLESETEELIEISETNFRDPKYDEVKQITIPDMSNIK